MKHYLILFFKFVVMQYVIWEIRNILSWIFIHLIKITIYFLKPILSYET